MTHHLTARLPRLALRSTSVAVAAWLFVLGACGSDGAGVTKAEFAARVNALCEAEHKQVDAIFADFPDEPTAQDMQNVVTAFVPILREYRADVKDVGRPSGDQDLYKDYMEKLDEVVVRYEQAGTDAKKVEELFNEDDDSLSKLEGKLGLDVCASR